MPRRVNDWYPTPSWATQMLVKRVTVEGTILECCSGDGAIANALDDAIRPHPRLVLNDLDLAWRAEWNMDATDPRSWARWPVCQWVVTNPPFTVAAQIVPLAVAHAVRGVAMLLRLSYLEPCAGRGRWLVENPPTRLIVLPRISFTGDGKTDSVTCAWFVWERLDYGQQSIDIVPATPDGQLALFAEATT